MKKVDKSREEREIYSPIFYFMFSLERRIVFRNSRFAADEITSVSDMANSGRDGQGIPERDERGLVPVCDTLDEALESELLQRVFNQFSTKNPNTTITLENVKTLAGFNEESQDRAKNLIERNPSAPKQIQGLLSFWQTHYLKWGEYYKEKKNENMVARFEAANEIIDEMILNAERNITSAKTDFALESENRYLDVGAEFLLELENFSQDDPIDFGDEAINNKVRGIPVITNVHTLVRHLALKTNSDKRQDPFTQFARKEIYVIENIINAIIPSDYVSLPVRIGVATELIVLNKKSFAEMIVSTSHQFQTLSNIHGVEFDSVLFLGVPFEAFEDRKGRKYKYDGDDGEIVRSYYDAPYYREETEKGEARYIGFVSDKLRSKGEDAEGKDRAQPAAGNRYHGNSKKPALESANNIALEKGYLPVHGAAIEITLKTGRSMVIVIAGESSTGKSEMIEQLRRDPMTLDIRIIADDMLHMERYDDGTWNAMPCETDAFDNVSNGDKRFQADRLAATTVVFQSKGNARTVSRGISDFAFKNEKPRKFKVDMLLYANNWEATTEIKKRLQDGKITGGMEWVCGLTTEDPGEEKNPLEIFEDGTHAYDVFHEGKRFKNQGTTVIKEGDVGVCMYGTNYAQDTETPFGNPFKADKLQGKLNTLWRQCIEDFYNNNLPVGQVRTMIETTLQDPETGHDQDKVQLAESASKALVRYVMKHGNREKVGEIRRSFEITDDDVQKKAHTLYIQKHPERGILSDTESVGIYSLAEEILINSKVRRWLSNAEEIRDSLLSAESRHIEIALKQESLESVQKLSREKLEILLELYHIAGEYPGDDNAKEIINTQVRRDLIDLQDKIHF